MAPTTFHIRNAGSSPSDADFIVAAFDSTIPYLESTGNSGQWGTQLFSEKDGFIQSTRDDVGQSEKFRQTGQGERIRTFIAQVHDTEYSDSEDGLVRHVDDEGKTFLPVGAITFRDDEFSEHILVHEDLKPHAEQAKAGGGFLFVDVLITDHRVGQRRRGAGGALVERVKEHAREQGKKAVYIDCWTGGTGKLVPYYEKFGFKVIQAFEVKRKDGSVWPAKLMRVDISND
ncbi:Uncharacterized protein TPAR_00855 [Tolypocladium paradoxum]|uniref:N-acetyltransferase domain-containing protein n=1 Tax=Tolypocladium paradoxum TaxID=94208 RepID=A0A2S4L926_9HYPO|nr:Uncharacterized protein TPAR_00855 [Tolypocladium paradoxum]